jgi:GT2 family glycosyltransferase
MILVATPTWNRRAIVTLTAAALQASDRRPEDTDYFVTDDASTEYSEEDLKAL